MPSKSPHIILYVGVRAKLGQKCSKGLGLSAVATASDNLRTIRSSWLANRTGGLCPADGSFTRRLVVSHAQTNVHSAQKGSACSQPRQKSINGGVCLSDVMAELYRIAYTTIRSRQYGHHLAIFGFGWKPGARSRKAIRHPRISTLSGASGLVYCCSNGSGLHRARMIGSGAYFGCQCYFYMNLFEFSLSVYTMISSVKINLIAEM